MPDSDPMPEQQARLRRLLAEVRVEEPMPAEVAARLDEALAELAGAPAPVVDLSTGRRRRRAGRLLLAAAAVVVAGLGVGQLVDSQGGSATSDGGDAARPDSADEPAAGSYGPEAAGPSPTGESTGTRTNGTMNLALRYLHPAEPLRRLPRVREESFGRDVTRVRDRLVADTAAFDRSRARRLPVAKGAVCGPARWGRGTLVVVRSDTGLAVLALRPPRGETQVADLLACDDAKLLTSVTLSR